MPCAVLALVCLLVLVSTPDESSAFIRKVLHKFEKNVLRKVAKPVKEVFREVVKKPVKSVLKALKEVRKTDSTKSSNMRWPTLDLESVWSVPRLPAGYSIKLASAVGQTLRQQSQKTADWYRVEKITPCANGQHDIVKAEQPVEIHVTVIQDRYCRKCGQHFFSGGDPKAKDEL